MGTQIFDSQIKDNIALTGTPTAPTPSVDDDSTRIATTEFIKNQVASDTVKGMVKVGSNISVADGVISVPEATETVKGVVELATPAEVLAGVDTQRGITPATLTAKILGTVSQVNGVPTGAVIERGTNANGNYVKFADGTMICTKFETNPGTPEQEIYITDLYMYSIVWTLPATFCNGNYFIGGCGAVLSFSKVGGTSTSIEMKAFSKSTTMTSVAVNFIAIGRWC